MNGFNVILATSAIVILLILFFASPLLTKKINRPWFWYAASIFLLAYFIGARWIIDVFQLVDYENTKVFVDDYVRSYHWSKVFLLDMCPLMAFLLPLSICINSKLTIAKTLAPITLIGSLITLVGLGLNTPNDIDSVSPATYIFFGTSSNRMYFMMHFLSAVLAVLVITQSKTYTKYSFSGTMLFYFGFLAYELIMINALNITNNATGLVEGDWYRPNNVPSYLWWYSQYGFVYNMWPMSFPTIVCVWYTFAVVGNWIIMLCKNCLTFDKDKKATIWYKDVKYLTFLKHFDNWCNTVNNKIKKKFLFWLK